MFSLALDITGPYNLLIQKKYTILLVKGQDHLQNKTVTARSQKRDLL